jgi:hypothetical protein
MTHGTPRASEYRQALYVGFIGLSVVGSAPALSLFRFLNSPTGMSALGRALGLWVIAVHVIYAALYAAFPANPDADEWMILAVNLRRPH